MEFTIANNSVIDQPSSCVIVGIYEDATLSPTAEAIDKQADGLISRLVKRGDIKGKSKQTLLIHDVPNSPIERLLVVGLGKQGKIDQFKYTGIINAAAAAIIKANAADITVCLAEVDVNNTDEAWRVEQLATVFGGQLYRFDQCKSDKGEAPTLDKVQVYVSDATNGNAALLRAEAITQGMNVCKELGNLPGNICTPTYLAEQGQQMAKQFSSIDCEILEEADMKKLGMGCLLSVSAGSEQPAKLVVMQYSGGNKGDQPIALVGKGITFDSGGISIKPASAMDEMKYDMCGAATVFGTLRAIAEMKLPINMVCVVAASENLPGSRATKPGDIVTSMSGQTVEVLNTDAEGRLVLSDALTYVGKFKPKAVIDIATLTGAMVVALGHHITGMMTNHQPLADELLAAGNISNDAIWQMPMTDEFQSELDSNFADIANIGDRWGGSITAACFLSRFTKDYQWAHLDIAGTAWKSGKAKGATGRPVALLTHYLISQANK